MGSDTGGGDRVSGKGRWVAGSGPAPGQGRRNPGPAGPAPHSGPAPTQAPPPLRRTGRHSLGAHMIAFRSVSSCDPALWKVLFDNIVLSGGTGSCSGLRSRMQRELCALVSPTIAVEVRPPSHPGQTADGPLPRPACAAPRAVPVGVGPPFRPFPSSCTCPKCWDRQHVCADSQGLWASPRTRVDDADLERVH